ncbi:MAG: protease modulator HflC, partial [Pseudomonas sp.]
MSNKSLISVVAAAALGLMAWNSFYIVQQTEKAVLLQFGKIV